jgi:hypothetical protein
MKDSIRLGLLENSHAFLVEAATNALNAKENPRAWQFAILHVAQSLELSLKALLRQIHPALVYRSVDNPSATVSTGEAFNRLRLPHIGNLTFEEADAKKTKSLIELRNRITHSEFDLRPEHASAKFFEAFAFVADFQSRYLKTDVVRVLGEIVFSDLLTAKEAVDQLARRALRLIEDEGISEDQCWDCPDCGHPTFVIEGQPGVCYTCRYEAETAECAHCGEVCYAEEFESFEDALEWACGEGGRAELHNDYGYSERSACSSCTHRILADIRDQRDAEETYFRMMDAHLRGYI